MSEKVELRMRDVKSTNQSIDNGGSHNVVKSDKNETDLKERGNRCTRLQEGCTACCIPCLTSHHPLPENANFFQKIRHGLMLPPHGNIASYLQFAVVCLQVWIVLYAWTHKEALPGGNYFSLLILFICTAIGGYLISFIHLPPLLGMLIMGLLLKNLPVVRYVGDNIDGKWSAALRKVALAVILTRAGLGLDVIKLKKLSWAVLRLAFIPCAAEIITAGVLSRYLLGFPWAWSLMLGCIMGALSPAVTVPSLVSLQDRRYGIAKGIPTMLLAAGGLDNVLCVTGFSVFFGIIFSDSDLVLTIFKGPIGVLVGLAYGFGAGIFMWYIPAKDCGNKVFFRSMILLGAGLVAIFGSSVIKLSGAGPIGCLTTATVAAYKWRQRRVPGEPDEVSNVMALSWLIVQHFLFGLIGSAVDVSKIQSNTAGLGIATLAIGLAVRSVFSFTVTMGTGFNIKERVFITLTWLSKATVQAATGGLAIAEVMLSDKPDPEYVKYGTDVLTISVLAIIICAPIGATLMAVLGPRFLVQGDSEEVMVEVKTASEETEDQQHIINETEVAPVIPMTPVTPVTPDEIKPLENNQFKSELSLTLQNRLSRQSLVEAEQVVNHVDTDADQDELKSEDNQAFEETELVIMNSHIDSTSNRHDGLDNPGFVDVETDEQNFVNAEDDQLKEIGEDLVEINSAQDDDVQTQSLDMEGTDQDNNEQNENTDNVKDRAEKSQDNENELQKEYIDNEHDEITDIESGGLDKKFITTIQILAPNAEEQQ